MAGRKFKKITEEMGEGFKLTNPTHENTEISYIEVDIDSELYMDEKIFSDCSRLKDIIYDYATEEMSVTSCNFFGQMLY